MVTFNVKSYRPTNHQLPPLPGWETYSNVYPTIERLAAQDVAFGSSVYKEKYLYGAFGPKVYKYLEHHQEMGNVFTVSFWDYIAVLRCHRKIPVKLTETPARMSRMVVYVEFGTYLGTWEKVIKPWCNSTAPRLIDWLEIPGAVSLTGCIDFIEEVDESSPVFVRGLVVVDD